MTTGFDEKTMVGPPAPKSNKKKHSLGLIPKRTINGPTQKIINNPKLKRILYNPDLSDQEVGQHCKNYDLLEYSELKDKEQLTKAELFIVNDYEHNLGVSGNDFWKVKHYLDLEKCWEWKYNKKTSSSQKNKVAELMYGLTGEWPTGHKQSNVMNVPEYISKPMTFNEMADKVQYEVYKIRRHKILKENNYEFEINDQTISFDDPRNYFDEDALLADIVQEISPKDYTPAGRVEVLALLLNANMRIDCIPSLTDGYASCGAYQMTHATYSNLYSNDMTQEQSFDESIISEIINKDYFFNIDETQRIKLSSATQMSKCVGIEQQTRAAFYLGYYNLGRFQLFFLNTNKKNQRSNKLIKAWNNASTIERKRFIISISAAMFNRGEDVIFPSMGQALGDCQRYTSSSKYAGRAVGENPALDQIRDRFIRELGTKNNIASEHSINSNNIAVVLTNRRTNEPSPTEQLAVKQKRKNNENNKTKIISKEKNTINAEIEQVEYDYSKLTFESTKYEPVEQSQFVIADSDGTSTHTAPDSITQAELEMESIGYKVGNEYNLLPRTDETTQSKYYTFSMPDWEETELNILLKKDNLEILKELNHDTLFMPKSDMSEIVLVPISEMDERLFDGKFVNIYVTDNDYEKTRALVKELCEGDVDDNLKIIQIYSNYYDAETPPDKLRIPLGIRETKHKIFN